MSFGNLKVKSFSFSSGVNRKNALSEWSHIDHFSYCNFLHLTSARCCSLLDETGLIFFPSGAGARNLLDVVADGITLHNFIYRPITVHFQLE